MTEAAQAREQATLAGAVGDLQVFVAAREDLPTRELIRARLQMQDWITKQEYKLRWAGMISGLVLALAFLTGAVFLINGDHDAAGTVLGSVDLVALVTVFVLACVPRRHLCRALGQQGGQSVAIAAD